MPICLGGVCQSGVLSGGCVRPAYYPGFADGFTQGFVGGWRGFCLCWVWQKHKEKAGPAGKHELYSHRPTDNTHHHSSMTESHTAPTQYIIIMLLAPL